MLRVDFEELAVRHYRAAYRTARAIVQSHTEAEDAVQDALMLAYRRLDSFRGDSTFGTWLIAITRNQAITRVRARRRHDRTMVPAGDALVERCASRERSPEDVVLDGERRRHLVQCVAALPAKLRDTLRLASSGRHSYDEIAAMMGAATGTIKSRVWQARRIVATGLRSRHGPPARLDNYEGHRR